MPPPSSITPQPGARRHAREVDDARGPDFRLLVTAGAHGTVVIPQGELDLATTPELEALLMARTGRVLVDLREVTFADGAALHALVRAEARSRRNGMNLSFVAGDVVARLIEAVGLSRPLTLGAPPTT